MVGRVSAVVLGGLLLAAAFAAPDALARRGGGPGGGRGYDNCRQEAACGCEQQQARDRQRDGSCRQDPAQCPKRADCPGPGAGPQRQGETGKGADNQ